MPAGLSEFELGALRDWTRAQQAAHSHRHLAEQAQKDESKAKKDEEEKKGKKKEQEGTKADKVKAVDVVGNLLKSHIPALYEFLNLFGPPHVVLPVFIAFHFLLWALLPSHLIPFLPITFTHLIPLILGIKSLCAPAFLLDNAYQEAKKEWSKQTEKLRKEGKDKAEFPDPPEAPPHWQKTARDRLAWLTYWTILGFVEFLEGICFGEDVGGLIWWPKMKAVGCVSLYFVWETHEKGRQTVGAAKVIDPFLPDITADLPLGSRKDQTRQKR